MPAIRFQTKLFTIGSRTILKLPPEASAQLPSRGQTMVKGTCNGIDFQTPLEPDGRGSHWFAVDSKLLTAAGVAAGDSVDLEVASIKDWPEPDVPEDIRAALAAHPEQQQLWQDITPLARWDWIRWIRATNNAETRNRRIAVAISKMQKGERRPCCFNRNMCTVPEVSKNGMLLEPEAAQAAVS